MFDYRLIQNRGTAHLFSSYSLACHLINKKTGYALSFSSMCINSVCLFWGVAVFKEVTTESACVCVCDLLPSTFCPSIFHSLITSSLFHFPISAMSRWMAWAEIYHLSLSLLLSYSVFTKLSVCLLISPPLPAWLNIVLIIHLLRLSSLTYPVLQWWAWLFQWILLNGKSGLKLCDCTHVIKAQHFSLPCLSYFCYWQPLLMVPCGQL